jgi:hypothetical protein
VLLLVGLVFAGMAVYIKLTYFIGYRATNAVGQQQPYHDGNSNTGGSQSWRPENRPISGHEEL